MAAPETRYDVTLNNKTKAGFKKIQSDLKKTKSASQKLSKAMTVMATAFVAFRAIGAVAGIWKNFGQAMSDLSAITGATGKDLEFLKIKSLEFGAATTLSASQAAEAFRLVASAKPDLLENGEALAAVTAEAITLAEASGSTLPEAASTLTLALNQTGASADEANRFINVLAAGAKFGSSVIGDTSEAIAKSGLVAGAAGTGFEEMNAAIQVLAKNTIFGAEAGTDLRNIYLNLTKQTNEKFKPAMVGFTQAMKNIKAAGLDSGEMLKIFGKRNITAATAMVRNTDLLEELTGKLTGTNIAAEQAAIRVDNLSGDWKRLGSTWETSALLLGDVLDPAMRGLVSMFTRIGQWVSTLIVGFKILGTTMVSFAAQAASALTFDFEQASEIGRLRDEKLVGMEKELDLIWQTKGAKEKLNATELAAKDAERIAKLKERLEQEESVKSAARTAAFEKASLAEELALNDKYAKSLFKLEESLLTEDQRLALSRENREFMVEDAFQIGLVSEARRNTLLLDVKKQFEADKTALEQKAVNERHRIQQRSLGAAANIFSSLGALMSRSGKKQTAESRAMAKISIGISTAQAIMNALKVSPYPLGVALAAGAAIQGATQLSAVGGSGGSTSTTVNTPTNTSPIAPPPNADGYGQTPQKQQVNITLNGSGYSPDDVRELIESINTELDDGSELNVS